MNPEDNQDNNTPDLDQVAADLTAAISDGTIDSPASDTPATNSVNTTNEVPSGITVETAVETSSETPTDPTPETLITEPVAEVATEPVAAEPVTEAPSAEPVVEAQATESVSETQPTQEAQPAVPVVPIDVPNIEAPADLATASINGPVTTEPQLEETPAETSTELVSETLAGPISETPVEAAPETPTIEPIAEESPANQLSPESPEATSTSFVDQPASPEDNSEKSNNENSEDDEEDQLKPADPVPGSIGSAINYSETAPDHSEPVVKKKKPINKANLRLIIIIIAAVALIAVVVIILLFIFSSGSNKATTTKAAATTDVPVAVMSSLTCTLSTTDSQTLISYGNATSAEEKYLATFSDDELYDIAKTATIEYEDEATVRHSQNNVKNIYESKFKNVGLTADPFESTYSISGSTLSIQHYAVAEDIDATTAAILDIPLTNGEPDTSLDSLKQAYKGKKYTCSSKVDK